MKGDISIKKLKCKTGSGQTLAKNKIQCGLN